LRLVELKTHDGRIACERCLVAEAALTRMRGLLGRSGLGEGEGLLLRPASSIHTFFMRFPIDAVFLGRSGEVLKVAQHLAPWRAARCSGARSVLELPAGESSRRGIEPGVQLLPV
jgi:uncharacterized protein